MITEKQLIMKEQLDCSENCKASHGCLASFYARHGIREVSLQRKSFLMIAMQCSLLKISGIASLYLMLGNTFLYPPFLVISIVQLLACWFIRAFIYGCLKSA